MPLHPPRKTLLIPALALALTPLLLVAACATAKIKGTDLDDTAQNREIVDVVERYRVAVESRDARSLKALASKHYYENASTTHTSGDDWGRPELEEVVERFKKHVMAVNYVIAIKAVRIVGNRADVDFVHTWAFQYTDGERDAWTRSSDRNRLELIKESDGWHILSGM